jgi:hypothetical protein
MKSWVDKVNGYGVLLRFIMPIMVGAIGWLTISLIMDIKGDIGEIKADARGVAIGMANHLEHHRVLEISLAERLTSIEMILKRK